MFIDNPNNELIIKRTNIINNFCSKISLFKYIINSDEFKDFLNENKNNDESIIYHKLKYNEILLKYKNTFKNINKDNEEIDINKIKDSIVYIKNNINNLLEFQNDVSLVMKEKENEINNLNELLEIFTDYEKNILIQYTNNDLTKLIFMNPENGEISKRINNLKNYIINPFKKLLDWIENDILDFKSMLNALEKFENLILLYKSDNTKIIEINKKISEINKNNSNSNNINYLNILIGCSTSLENELEDLIIEKEIVQNEKKDLFEIINIIDKINDEFVKKFKKEKMEKYNEQFKIFIEEDKKNRDLINDLWNCISKATNKKNPGKENKEQTTSP